MRREFEAFYARFPENIKKPNIISLAIQKLRLTYYKILFKKIASGSEKWHKIQQKISLLSSTTEDCAIRSLFYEKSLKQCSDNIYVLPNVTMCYPYNISIGNTVFINRGVYITARDSVSIGDNCMIGPYTVINSGDHIYSDRTIPIRDQGHKTASIVICDNVWIGANVTIKHGVTIGKGAIIGAGAIVTHSIPEYAIAVGCPARVVRYR